MDETFWHRKWEAKEIGFHRSEVNPLLVKWFGALSLQPASRVFLPLCGKTRDIAWLLSQGYRVAGAELSEIAVGELFLELGMTPVINDAGRSKHYAGKDIDIFAGNIFDLSESVPGPIDAVYDRAALVALPEDMRQEYTRHLMQITQNAPQLVIVFDYDQNLLTGPPFSITASEMNEHYSDVYNLKLLETMDVPGGLKEKCAAKENVWLLSNT
jgi:thiopurine S-methyltransferase